MTIQIATGRGWFNKRWVENSTPYTITLEASDVVLSRYAAICVRVDTNESGRTAQPYVKYSEYGSTPSKPTMERSETVNEYCLAYVYIGAGVNEISEINIEDTRGNSELCGWVTGLIQQLSTTTLFTQWEAVFAAWFDNLQDVINENTELMLVNALPKSDTVTLIVSEWIASGSGYSQTVPVVGMTDTKTAIVQADDDTSDVYANSGIKCTAQADGSLTFTAVSLPTVDVKVNVNHFGV
jgi:hypothetical protein